MTFISFSDVWFEFHVLSDWGAVSTLQPRLVQGRGLGPSLLDVLSLVVIEENNAVE